MTVADTVGLQPARGGRLAHVPALDGLRGLAVAAVLLFHAGHLRGGFLGVDLFFVLSGFLITSLLVLEWRSARAIDLLRFWARRARRLLPAALVLLLATTAYAGLHLHDGDLGRFRGDALSAAADVANWRAVATDADYWAAQAEPSPLRHMWSLSIEEQLYVVWPVVLLLAFRRGTRRKASFRTATQVAAVLYVGSIAAMVVLGRHGTTAWAYYGTDTRASAVLVGGLTALLLHRWRAVHDGEGGPEWIRLAAPTSAGVLALAWLWADGTSRWLYLWGFPLFGLAAAVVVAWAFTAGPGLARRLLSIPALTALGTVSYGVYLIHWPVYVAIDDDIGLHGWSLTGLRIGVTLLLAMLSFHVVERPIRSGRVPTRWWRVLALGGLAVVAAAVVLVTAGAHAAPSTAAPRIPPAGTGLPRLLLLGDSQASALVQGAGPALTDRVAFGQYASVGCGIGPGLATTNHVPVEQDLSGDSCREAADRFVRIAEEAQPDILLLHIGAWDIFDRDVDGMELAFGSSAWDDATRDNLVDVLGRLQATTARLVVLAAPCFPDGGRAGADVFGQAAIDVGEVRVDDRRVRRWNELLRDAAASLDVEVLPYDDLLCDAGRAGDPERPDGVHVDEAGAEVAWTWILGRVDP